MKTSHVIQQGKTFAVLLAVVFLYGCATVKPMAITAETAAIDTSKESVLLLTIKTSNAYKPGYQPQVTAVRVKTMGVEQEEKVTFATGYPYRVVEDQFNESLVSLSLAPGKYQLQDIFGISFGFLIRATFAVPVYSEFEVPANKVIYLGHLEANNRERANDDEAAAGSIIPLIDQGVTGYAGGTFDVAIIDNYEKDISLFQEKFIALKNVDIEKIMLSPWKKRTDDEVDELR